MCSGRDSGSCSTYDTRRVTVKRHVHHLILKSCCTPASVNKCKLHKENINPIHHMADETNRTSFDLKS